MSVLANGDRVELPVPAILEGPYATLCFELHEAKRPSASQECEETVRSDCESVDGPLDGPNAAAAFQLPNPKCLPAAGQAQAAVRGERHRVDATLMSVS